MTKNTPDLEDLSKYIQSEKHLKLRASFFEFQEKFPEIEKLVKTLSKLVKLEKDMDRQKFNQNKQMLEGSYKYDRIKNTVMIYVCKKLYRMNEITDETYYKMLQYLRTKNSRSHSGILEVAIMTSPWNMKGTNNGCDDDCYMCPNQEGFPRSYIKEEPGSRRAAQNGFDPFKQLADRSSTYLCHGQPVDKLEIIVLGGTWSSYEPEYQEQFCCETYYAANTFYHGGEKPRPMKTLEEEQTENETSLCRIIGFTIETRPDKINPEEILRFNKLGITRVQLGVQTTHDRLLKKINRGCYNVDTVRAIRLLKDSGFKVLIHIMPNLPDSNPDLDRECFDTIATNPDYQTDELKIYPTSVTTTSDKDDSEVFTVIEKWYRDGKYVPYSNAELKEVIKDFKEKVPQHIRISRVFRDIPLGNITGGADIPNLRQHLQKEMGDEGRYCGCIRCREIKNEKFKKEEVYYRVDEYKASEGIEYFISANIIARYKNPYEKTLVGFCRLRIPNPEVQKYHFQDNLRFSSLVRELHIYGQLNPTYQSKNKNNTNKEKQSSNSQHQGIGSELLQLAEDISRKHRVKKINVISGVGVRGYYRRKHKYYLHQGYMVKDLTYELPLIYFWIICLIPILLLFVKKYLGSV